MNVKLYLFACFLVYLYTLVWIWHATQLAAKRGWVVNIGCFSINLLLIYILFVLFRKMYGKKSVSTNDIEMGYINPVFEKGNEIKPKGILRKPNQPWADGHKRVHFFFGEQR